MTGLKRPVFRETCMKAVALILGVLLLLGGGAVAGGGPLREKKTRRQRGAKERDRTGRDLGA